MPHSVTKERSCVWCAVQEKRVCVKNGPSQCGEVGMWVQPRHGAVFWCAWGWSAVSAEDVVAWSWVSEPGAIRVKRFRRESKHLRKLKVWEKFSWICLLMYIFNVLITVCRQMVECRFMVSSIHSRNGKNALCVILVTCVEYALWCVGRNM